MAEHFSELARKMIKYQKDNSMPDTLLAFNTHITVERIHSIKTMSSEPTDDEFEMISQVIGN